jgi:uncharacterized membrane protein YoaK (UPF0700 family)
MKPGLPILLSANAGFVDAAGFLALHGLFTTHVTGNFVTLGATLVLGTSGAVSKLLAFPMFCIGVISAGLIGHALRRRGRPALPILLASQTALLAIAAALAISLGPFANGDGWSALLTGMTLVSAMAIQNAVHRVHLPNLPPSTVMTGTSTQIMLDLADLVWGLPEASASRPRLRRMLTHVAAFAFGCAAAALLYATLGVWCFAVPPLLALAAILSRVPESETAAK